MTYDCIDNLQILKESAEIKTEGFPVTGKSSGCRLYVYFEPVCYPLVTVNFCKLPKDCKLESGLKPQGLVTTNFISAENELFRMLAKQRKSKKITALKPSIYSSFNKSTEEWKKLPLYARFLRKTIGCGLYERQVATDPDTSTPVDSQLLFS